MRDWSHRLSVGGLWLLCGWLATAGCTLSNSLFNARSASRRGDALLARGLPDSAAVWFGRSATSAERRLAQAGDTPTGDTPTGDTPTSDVHAARLIAGRSLALAAVVSLESCARAHGYLAQFLSEAPVSPSERWEAEQAMAICDMRTTRASRAAVRLGALTSTPDRDVPTSVVRDVRRWQVRALLASGDVAGADLVLQSLDAQDARWDLVDAAWAARDWPRAESLLVHAADAADLRPTVAPLLASAWADGERARVEHVVQAYDASRAARRERARLLIMLGDAARGSGDTERARTAYERVLTAYADDSVSRGDAKVGRLQLALTALPDASPIESARRMRQLLFDAAPLAWQHPRFHDLAASVALYLVLATTDDPSGAAGYLAGEVARDALDAPQVAASTWRAVAEFAGAPLAARALYALWLQSARSSPIRDELLTRFPESPMADVLRGESMRDLETHRQRDGLLEGRWLIAQRSRDDSLRAWRDRGVLSDMDDLDGSSSERSSRR